MPEHKTGTWERRDILGVHPQKQEGLYWVGACVPAGRLQAQDFEDMARVAEVSFGTLSARRLLALHGSALCL